MGAKQDNRKREYHWFIEPLNGRTDASLAEHLPPENAIVGERDDKGVPHNVYRVGSNERDFFRKSKADFDLDFEIYVREGHGKMRLASFLPALTKRRKKGFPRVAQVER